MSTYEPQVGDTVKFEGVVATVNAADEVRVDSANGSRFFFYPEHLTLVERPEPTYTVELTASDLRTLCERTCTDQKGLWDKLNVVRNQANNR